MKGWKRVVAAVLLCVLLAVGVQGRAQGLVEENWGFESGSLAGWSVTPEGGWVEVMQGDVYTTPRWGAWMAVLGHPAHEAVVHRGTISTSSLSGDTSVGRMARSANPLYSDGANGLQRTFVARSSLRFAYNVCTWSGDLWNAGFIWWIEDEEGHLVAGSVERSGATARAMQVEDVLSSGWQVVDANLSRYQGQTLTINLVMRQLVPGDAPARERTLGDGGYGWSWAYVDFAPVEPLVPADAPPEVRFVYPVAAGGTVSGSEIEVTVEGWDDIGVTDLRLLVNGVEAASSTVGNRATFRVALQEGINTLRAVVTDISGKQAVTETTIICDSRGPVLTFEGAIPTRVDGSTLTLAGTVLDATSGLRSVAINGTAVGVDSLGGFSQVVPLRRGANTISIEAIDNVGNVTRQSFAIESGSLTAPTSVYIVLTVGKTSMEVNGMPVALDAAPFIKDGRTLLPIRALIETLGGTVQWNAQTKTATVALGSRTVALTVGSTKALVNGSPVTLDVAPMIVKGRTFLPLRAVAESLGLDLAWDAGTQTISLTYWP